MNARDYAFSLLHAARLPGWSKIKLSLAKGPLDARDRALGESIAAEVTKNLLLLRHAIRHYSGRDLKQIDPAAQVILSIAIAQLRYFDRVPASAAVDEAVEQAKRLKLGRAAGFINAVLRRATREPELPLPDEKDVEAYARLALSHPPEFLRRLLKLMGQKQALLLCAKNNTEAPTIVRAGDTFKIGLRDGIEAKRHHQDGMWVVEGATEADFANWSDAGTAQVQDPTSALVVDRLKLSKGLRVLDRCCGLGTKTLQIAERIGNKGAVVATDPSQFRIDRLNETLSHRKIENVTTKTVGMLDQMTIDARFDRILVDAPCSNSGVIIRRPEARYRQDDKSLKSVLDLQRRILLDTVGHLAPGGLLIYSTCSIWPEENGEQVQWLIKQTDTLELLEADLTLPATSPEAIAHHDGGFVAVLRRRELA
jgi:16S rRNA (cytosine967-C5)-methyltransferase